MRRAAVAIVVLLSVLAGGVGTVGGQTERVGVSGALIDLPGETEQETLSEYREVVERAGFEAPTDVMYLHSPNGDYYILLTEDVRPGEVRVSGASLNRPTENTAGVMVGLDVRNRETDPPAVGREQVVANPDRYSYELVRVRGHFTATTFAVDPVDAVWQAHEQAGWASNDGTGGLLDRPGRLSRESLFAVAQAEDNLLSRRGTFGGIAGAEADGARTLTYDYDGTRWWVDAESTVTALVLPGESGPSFYVVDVAPSGESVGGPAVLARNAEQYAGEVVTVSGSGLGVRLSTQETLEQVAGCGPNSVVVPSAGCLPLVTDTTIHTGALYGAASDSPGEVVPYVGISNQLQQRAAISESGQYRVTGRVVAAGQIDPRLDGYVLVVYDRERTGRAAQRAGGQVLAQQVRDELRADLRDQLRGESITTTAPTTTATTATTATGATTTDTTTTANTPTTAPTTTATPAGPPRNDRHDSCAPVLLGLPVSESTAQTIAAVKNAVCGALPWIQIGSGLLAILLILSLVLGALVQTSTDYSDVEEEPERGYRQLKLVAVATATTGAVFLILTWPVIFAPLILGSVLLAALLVGLYELLKEVREWV